MWKAEDVRAGNGGAQRSGNHLFRTRQEILGKGRRWRRAALKASERHAQFKQVRMFVISLTTPESAHVILGQLIDFRGKACLSSATQDKRTKNPSDHSLVKAGNRDPFTPGLGTVVTLNPGTSSMMAAASVELNERSAQSRQRA